MLKTYTITGPSVITSNGWYVFTINAPEEYSIQWSTTGDSFKYAQEEGNTFKIYVDGDTYEEHKAGIYCNVSKGIGDLGEQVSKSVSISTLADDAPVMPVARIISNPIATSATYNLDGSASTNVDGCKFNWIVTTDQLYSKVVGTTLNKKLDLSTVIYKPEYQLDGTRGYVNMSVTLQIFKSGCLVSEDNALVVIPDSVIDQL